MRSIRRAVPMMLLGLSLMCAAAPTAAARSTNPPPPPTSPSPAIRLTGECLERIAHATGATVEDIRDRTHFTIRRIAELHHQGAPAGAIVQAGENGKAAINARAAAGADRVTTEAANCLAALQQMNAPQQFIDAINAAKSRSLDAIGRARTNGREAIDRAVARATGPASATVE